MRAHRGALLAVSIAAVLLAAGSALAAAGLHVVSPSRAQRAAIVRAFGDPPRASPCLIVGMASSDHRYATVRPRFKRSCARWAFNGVNIIEHRGRRWRVVFEGSAYRCPVPRIPRRVQRELGVCR